MELPFKPSVPALSHGDKIIKAPLDDKKYIDWHEDDTLRDPTPANKRRTQVMQDTFPKNGASVKKGK